ncbi:MAG: SirB2 family protein [Proteobacteria bacterium]|nr:SirB2 family protein [Pseudomonadota bacterium]MDA0995133.1 SirB2 family protein [Pseudomonadota bacterium]
MWTLRLSVLNQPWLLAKFAALVIYIVLGAVALRRGKTMQIRTTAFVLALAIFAYIAGVAISKSMGSWLSLLLT